MRENDIPEDVKEWLLKKANGEEYFLFLSYFGSLLLKESYLVFSFSIYQRQSLLFVHHHLFSFQFHIFLIRSFCCSFPHLFLTECTSAHHSTAHIATIALQHSLPLAVSSTSWTPDEDCGVLIDALRILEEHKTPLAVLVTGVFCRCLWIKKEKRRRKRKRKRKKKRHTLNEMK